jgi:hypothetical protein
MPDLIHEIPIYTDPQALPGIDSIGTVAEFDPRLYPAGTTFWKEGTQVLPDEWALVLGEDTPIAMTGPVTELRAFCTALDVALRQIEDGTL